MRTCPAGGPPLPLCEEQPTRRATMLQPHVTQAEVQKLVELAARSTDGLAASRKWVVSPAVCRRYLAAGASAGAPGATAVLPFLLRPLDGGTRRRWTPC